MRRAIISIIIVLSLLSVNSTTTAPLDVSTLMNPDIPFSENTLMADIQSSGSNVPAVQYMDRIVTSQVLAISNSFASPDTHSSSIDLSSYQLPGWTLYQVQIDSDNITAITEREVIGVAKDHDLFKIEEYSDVNNWRYNSLTQGFYVMPHDGQLLNYSFYYDSPIYTPVQHGWAYYSILSDYQNSSSNLVAYTQLPTRVISGAGWENVTVSSIDLSANTEYYAVINGSALIETTFYPDIRWTAETAAGTFTTQQYDSRFSLWGSFPSEALLNYTYIPWNRTAAAALVFSNPNSISLNISGTPVSGSTWTVTSASNITTLQFSSNQSVNVFHNLILRYQKDVTADTLWKGVSSSDIMWNVTIDLSYPVVPETVVRYMNITNIPLDWVATGLYLGSSPGGSYSKSGSNVTCNMLSDGTWTLTSTAPNYAVDLSLYDSSDDSSISYMVANTVIIDANATIEDGVGTPQTGGTANLSILQSSTLIYSPAEIPASSGATDFQWDISATTNGNSTHSVEVYWISTDGLEAGYVTQEIFIYHSTNLVADDVSIEAFTEDVSAFSIGINFDKISPAQGLDDIPADVTYSFGSTVNASLTDDGGGRWTQVVNTTGMSNGVHLLTVYAEGFALENQSLVISVYLEHQTQALNWSWSNTNNITYTNSTKLSISYMELDNTPIDLAMVNVTVEGVPFDMTWDPVNETYWIELTGENFTGEGTYTLNVSAWKFGYEWQFQEINITIRSETTGLSFDVVYNPVSLNISYIESLFIQVTYDFNSVPIQSNTAVWITFNGSSQVDLVFNTTSAKWETILLGSNYLGGWDILIRASADGYSTRTNTTEFTVYEDTPLLSSDWISDSETTDYATNEPLTITLTDSTGTPITDATVSFTAFGTLYTSSSGPSGQYSFSIDPTETRGVETFVVSVVRTGFVSSQINLNLTVEATTSLQFQNLLSSEFEQWNLTIEVRYMDTFYSSAIENATVAVNLDGVDYILQYSSAAEVYMIEITLDLNPGDYTIYVSAFAEYAAYATNQAAFSVNAKEYVYLEVTFDGNLIAGQFMEIIATLRSNSTDPPEIPGETIRFEVSVYFENGTVVHYTGPTMIDSTNTEGVASVGFEVPFGNVDRLTARAIYDGSRTRWGAERTEVTGVEVSLFSLLFAFFTSGVGLMVVISMALLGIVATGYNKAVKPRKRAARLSLENQLQMFKDLETVQHFMAVYLDRGTCVFYHPFTEERIQPDLISGFIAAITSVYGEIKGDGVRGTLEEIQYHGLRLNSYSGQYIIGILILEGEMTPLLRERLQFFVELFENQYDQDLDGWTGLIDCFDPEWVVSTLNSAFNYAWHLPHKFGPTQKVSKSDAKILNYISAVRDEKNEFYIKNIISPLAEMLEKTEAEVLDRLLLLQDRGIIAPIGIQTILQRQGLALVDGSEHPMLEPQPVIEEDKLEPEEVIPEPIEEIEIEETPEEFAVEADVAEVVEPEPQIDPMDAFVQDVESLLVEKAQEEKKEKKKDDELDQFVKELREKIGEDEETED